MIDRLLPRCFFPSPGREVVCAVSGGPDSLALLALATGAELAVTAIHVDHGLRTESARDADVVRDAASRFGAKFESVRVSVERGPNVEARARAARYGALPAGALTGHTADDQAETVLLNLLWGAGLDGLRGMDPRCRPLRDLRRHETRALCDELGLVPLDDPMNHDRRLRRTRVRDDVLPLLDDVAARDVVPVIARQVDVLRDDAALLDELASLIDPTDVRALARAPVALARRAVRVWLRSDEHPPDRASVERVLAVARGDIAATEVAGGRRVTRSRGKLAVECVTVPNS